MPIKLPSLPTTSREHKKPTNSDAHYVTFPAYVIART